MRAPGVGSGRLAEMFHQPDWLATQHAKQPRVSGIGHGHDQRTVRGHGFSELTEQEIPDDEPGPRQYQHGSRCRRPAVAAAVVWDLVTNDLAARHGLIGGRALDRQTHVTWPYTHTSACGCNASPTHPGRRQSTLCQNISTSLSRMRTARSVQPEDAHASGTPPLRRGTIPPLESPPSSRVMKTLLGRNRIGGRTIPG